MKIVKLIFRNVFRHKLRAFLTILGVAIAVMAFGLLRTLVTSWYAGANAAAPDRLVTRNSVSFIFPLPLSYRDQILRVSGVKNVTYENWFGGVYIDKNHFFSRIACDPQTMLAMYPEYVLPPDQTAAFEKERDACIVGQKLADQYHFKIGDIIPIEGDIFPGKWQFVVRGIYHGKTPSTEETAMFFQWDYLNERMIKTTPTRANNVGWYAVQVNNPSDAARVSESIDALFSNSSAETKTETEKAFQAGFISMSSAIITSLQIISYVIIGIIFLVLANTMIMTARERIREYAVLKTLGFTSKHLMVLIFGESLSIAILGGIVGILITFPMAAGFAKGMSSFIPMFIVEGDTLLLAALFALIVGIVSAIFPANRAASMKIVDGLRQVG
ncbi:MAG TPA: ABC transporter permease [Candidatus Kapabacteria bacterium]|jgi:putative ABC transport system permease protein|nr:ABC transporter permease [Candidatus Kapabacteria bacterium]